MVKKCATGFAFSAICGLLVNMLIEIIVQTVTGMDNFNPIPPEYMKMFASERIAIEVYILLYGVIGAAFSGMTFIYEYHEIGIFLQNLIYLCLTGAVWIPILTLLWQLQKHPYALAGTLLGYAGSYIIISFIGYNTAKKDIGMINVVLKENNNREKLSL